MKNLGTLALITCLISFSIVIFNFFFHDPYGTRNMFGGREFSDSSIIALITGSLSFLFALIVAVQTFCPKCNKRISDTKLIDSVTTDTTPDKKDGTNDLRYTPSSETKDTYKHSCTCGNSFTSSQTSYN
jgi:hypothetical protein